MTEPRDCVCAEPVLPGDRIPAMVRSARELMLAAFEDPQLGLVDDRGLLEVLEQAYRLTGQVQALTARLVAEAETRQAAERVSKLSTAQWLHLVTNAATLRVFRAQVRQARRLCGDYPDVAAAQARGEVSQDQARAIVEALWLLPEDLDAEQKGAALADLLQQAGRFDPRELTVFGNKLVEVIAPERADEVLAQRLERERVKAERDRHLGLYPDYHGSWIIQGKLPNAVGEQLSVILEAMVNQRCQAARDTSGTGDGSGGLLDRGQARADALADIITGHAAMGAAPSHGGDRPRVAVTITLAELLAGLGHGTTEAGVDLPAAEVRQMACDADLIPAVLNGHGVPLDVGRAHRLVPAWLRAALVLRDQGCAFPGCDRPPRECEAHHLIPWYIHGPTALDNLVLLCPSHHARCEPATTATAVIENPHRWEARLNTTGLPEFLPPRTHDHTRAPRLHARYHLAAAKRGRVER